MKVFLIGFSSTMHTKVAVELQKKGLDVLYWTPKESTGSLFTQVKKQFPNTIFHEYLDALTGIWPIEVDTALFVPVSRELTHQLLDAEWKALLMIERIEYLPTTIGYKKHLYYEQVKYWSNILENMKPDAILFSDAPHTFYNFVLSRVAQLMGIKTIYYRRTKGTVGHLHFFTDYLDYQELRTVYHQALTQNIGLSDVSEEMRGYYSKQTNIQVDSTPFYRKGKFKIDKTKSMRIIPSIETLKRNIQTGNILKNIKNYIWFLFHTRRVDTIGNQYYKGWKIKMMQRQWFQKGKKWKEKYLSLQIVPDYNAKYIYVPMHFQPECATNPFGDIYDDQILLVDTLAKSIPEGWFVYVKENAIQWSWPQSRSGRFDGYYDMLLKNKNVRLVSSEISTFNLIQNSQAVATVTGTALWESVLRSKPALMFGSEWFMDCEGVFQIVDTKTCSQAIEQIKNGYVVDQKKVIAFLYAVEQVTLPGYVNQHLKGPMMFTEDENVDSIVNGIWTKLNT